MIYKRSITMSTNIIFCYTVIAYSIIKFFKNLFNQTNSSKKTIIFKTIISNKFINSISSHFKIFNYKSIFNHIYCSKFNKRIITINGLVKHYIRSFNINSIIFKTYSLFRLTSLLSFILIK